MAIERKQVRATFHWRPWGEDYEMVLGYRDDDTRKRYFAKSIEWVECAEGSMPTWDETLLVSEDDARRLVDSFFGTPAYNRGQMPEVVKAKDEHIDDLKTALSRANDQIVRLTSTPDLYTGRKGSAHE